MIPLSLRFITGLTLCPPYWGRSNGAQYRYRVGDGGWSNNTSHNFNLTTGLNPTEFTPVTVQTLVGGVVQKESTIPSMFKYATADNLVKGYDDWFRVLRTGYPILQSLGGGLHLGHSDAYNRADDMLKNSAGWTTNQDVNSNITFFANSHGMYDSLTNAILTNIAGVRGSLTGTALDDFNKQLRRLWLNEVPGDTNSDIDPLLNSIIEADIQAEYNDKIEVSMLNEYGTFEIVLVLNNERVRMG